MSEKKGKISLAGLTKGAGSSNFLSFRFSPDSEEIEEILQDSIVPGAQGCSESAPSSPKPSPGDVSPLKEYFIKEKHKWAHKWDKKSMSLDLDLKGKIITAIEDKKKSILSNFIPEEGGLIPQSQSIPENIATRVFSEESFQSSSYVSSSSSYQGAISKQSNVNDFENADDCEPKSDSPDGSTSVTEVEEIGIDMMNYVSNRSSTEEVDHDGLLDEMLEFVAPPECLRELFGGFPTLYQPTSVIAGFRTTPLEQEQASEELEDILPQAPTSTKPTFSQETQDSSISHGPSGVLFEIARDILLHPWSKYWITLLIANLSLPLGAWITPFLWFIQGILTVIVIGRGLSGADKDVHSFSSPKAPEANKSLPTPTEPMLKELKVPSKSRGWMTQMDGDYDVSTCHFRQTKVVFVRLDEHNLYLSYPHQKHRIPKRRLWNDPIINMDHIFVRHKVYSISGADISLVPDGLAKKRVWNKKYPIGITFPKWSVYSKVTPLPSIDSLLNATESSMAANGSGAAVNYNVNTADVSVTKQPDIPAISKQIVQKEIVREDCGSKTIFLFARCDREKDDWYRRLVAASKLGGAASYAKRSSPDNLNEYRDYMKRACPLLIPFLRTISNPDGWDNVSMASSRKSTPDKEKPSTSKNDSIQSDLENIVTIPQSPAFLNALIARLFFDFLKSNYWKSEVTQLIDKKLFYMKKPAYVEDIYVKELEMGTTVPMIQRVSAPMLDHQGLWIDLDITYEGTFCVALETHVNLLKLRKPDLDSDGSANTSGGSGKIFPNSGSPSTSKKAKPALLSPLKTNPDLPKRSRASVFDSEADDSGESSEDEADLQLEAETAPIIHDIDPNIQTKGQKLMNWAEKIAGSSIMNTNYVKKIVENLGSTPIVLSVELRSCKGTLAINIPPPPNDRIWLGFRTNPDMHIVARPKFGERVVTITHITEWIKRKLLLEFQRVAVCPNMNDITVPLMEFELPK